MTRFHFRAACVLDHRRQARERAQAAVASCERALRASADEIARADDRWHAAAALYTRTIRDGIDPDTLERHRVWMDRLRADGAGWRATYEARRREVARATAALTEVHQQVRVLERLRDRLERKHAAALGRQDRRELDEAAAIRFAARVGPGHDQDRAK